MADPLTLLRTFNLEKKEIREKDGEIIFNDLAYPKTARTRYITYGTNKENGQKDYYTLECLLFFLKNAQLRHPVYVKRAVEAEVPIVKLADRKDLLSYLTDKDRQGSDSIDKSAPLINFPVKRSATVESHVDTKKTRVEDPEQLQKDKQRLESMLGSSSGQGAAIRSDNIHDLGPGLTAGKIHELREKVIRRKRGTIKQTDDDSEIGGGGRYQMMDSELDVARDILSKERQWRTRTTCLESQAKNFGKAIFPIMQAIKAREEGKLAHRPPHGPEAMKVSSRPNQQTAYNRYAQEDHRKEETGEFKIDTLGTYHGITLKSITEGAKPKMQAPGTPVHPATIGAPGRSLSSKSNPSKPQKRTSRTPIIVIPAASTSLITMFNARDLLQDLRFLTTEEKKSQGARRENQILIQRTKDGGLTVPYQVIDNPLKLTADEWDRIVAVFVQGPAWQFKGWPWNGSPVEIFAKICAFHLRYEEQKLDANVAKWNVTVLSISQTRRHLDRANILRFWEMLEKYMLKHKPHLRS